MMVLISRAAASVSWIAMVFGLLLVVAGLWFLCRLEARLKPGLLLFHRFSRRRSDALQRHVDAPAGQDQVRDAHVLQEPDQPILQRLDRRETAAGDRFAVHAVSGVDLEDRDQVVERNLVEPLAHVISAADAADAADE